MLATAGLVIALASCGGEPRLASPTEPTPAAKRAATSPTPAPASPVVRTPAIGEIVWTASVDPETSQPGDAQATFAPDAPSIIAAAPGDFLPHGAVVQAVWTYNDTSLEPLTSSVTIDRTLDERWLSFRLNRDPSIPWPVGTYEIAVSLNGVEARRASIEVTESG